MKEYGHVMIIGGTGMLRDATQYLAAHARSVSMFARTAASLERLASSMSRSPAVIRAYQADYNDAPAFASVVQDACAALGPPDIVLGWIHDEEAAFALARCLSVGAAPFHFVHVVGSATEDLGHAMEYLRREFHLPHVIYHQVVLGFHVGSGESRWLTDHEISAGVIAAINTLAPLHVVGSIRPWQSRPG